ncbi:uncharacterized protein [Patagioenas fasciata]|uniref:uncharacterized protein n=1 Tax=Patagioenas fasciata TaxID=372321 RepID=UPI003A9A59D8
MEGPGPHSGLWGLILLPPTLLLLLGLCTRCRRRPLPPLDAADKPPPGSSFVIVTPCRGPPQPLPHPWEAPRDPTPRAPLGTTGTVGTTMGPLGPMGAEPGGQCPQCPQWAPRSPQPPQSHRGSTNGPPVPPDPDDDDVTYMGYVHVLPDQEVTNGTPPGGDSESSAQGDDYVNVPKGTGSSLGGSQEYVNVPSPHHGSDSEDAANYENMPREPLPLPPP